MKKASVFIGSGIIIVGIVVCGFLLVKQELDKRSGGKADNHKSQEKPDKEEQRQKEEMRKAPKYAIGDTVETMGFSYMVEQVEITKDSKGYRQPEGMMPLSEYSDTTLDESGNITNGYSYVMVHLKIKNLSGTEEILGVGNIYFKVDGMDVFEMGNSGEFQYFGKEEPGTYGKKYGLIPFSGGEEQSFIMIYVQRDDVLVGNKLYLDINPQGGYQEGVENETQRWILLKDQ